MTFKEALKFEQTITAKRFWILQLNGNGLHLSEGRAEKQFGRWVHFKRFAGWKDVWGTDKRAIRVATKGKKWDPVWLASELTRTDWKVQIISNEAKILLTQRHNYHKIYTT